MLDKKKNEKTIAAQVHCSNFVIFDFHENDDFSGTLLNLWIF